MKSFIPDLLVPDRTLSDQSGMIPVGEESADLLPGVEIGSVRGTLARIQAHRTGGRTMPAGFQREEVPWVPGLSLLPGVFQETLAEFLSSN